MSKVKPQAKESVKFTVASPSKKSKAIPTRPASSVSSQGSKEKTVTRKSISTITTTIRAISGDELILIKACQSNDIDAVYEQIWKGTNVNCRLPLVGSTPLSIACQNGYANIISVLIAYGADAKTQDEYGVTPTHWAANNSNEQIVRAIIEKGKLRGEDLSVQDSYGSTPLHFASVRNLTANVGTLISYGSDATKLNNRSQKACDVTTDEHIKNILQGEESRIVAEIKAQALELSRAQLKIKKSEKLSAVNPGPKTAKKSAPASNPQPVVSKGSLPTRKVKKVPSEQPKASTGFISMAKDKK